MTLVSQLNNLESSGLIRLAQAQPELEYLFRHALVQEAAYDSLLKNSRRQLHQAVGEALERTYADRLASRELAPLLARHFDEAGDDRRALKYFTLAGDVAARVYANAEAVMHYARALDIAKRATHFEGASHVLIHLYTHLGHALELNAQDTQALANYEDMEAVARERGDRSMELAALLARATIHVKPTAVRDAAQGQALSERALALARELGERAAEAKALWNLMLFHKFGGQVAEILTYGEQSLAIARELDLREQMAYVLNDIYVVYMSIGQMQRARAALDEAQQLWRELGVLNMLADNLAGAASLHVLAGEYDRALALSDEALRVSQSIGNLWNQSYSLYMIDLVYMERGEMGRAIQVAEECIRLAERAGFMPPLIQTRTELAFIYGILGAFQRAFEMAELTLAAAKGQSPLLVLGMAGPTLPLAVVAYLHALDGNLAEAEALLAEAQSGFDASGAVTGASFFIGLADSQLALMRGDYARIVAEADAAIPMLRQTGIRLYFPDALYLKGKALLGMSRTDEAWQTLNEARAEAEAIGSRRTLWPILMALSEIEAQRGNPAEAHALRQQAREIIEYIAGHAGAPELRASFLNLPDVREALAQAS